MSLLINSNIDAIYAQDAVRRNEKQVAATMERLSTGSRINSVKDDAAGLAISTNMLAQIDGMSVAQRNTNDGISLLQTADGALGSIEDILQRVRELSIQSSNDTNSAENRFALNAEAKALFLEIQRIASETSFNGIKLLDGTFQEKQLQISSGKDNNDSLEISINSAKVDEKIDSQQSSQDPEISLTTTYSATATGFAIGDSVLTDGDLVINGVAVGPSTSASARDIAYAINQKTSLHSVTAIAQTTNSTSVAILVPTTSPAVFEDNTVNVTVSPSAVTESGINKLIYTFTRTGDTSQELAVNFKIGGTANYSDFTTTTQLGAALPVKDWTRLLGSPSNDGAFASTTGSDGAIYICGYTDGVVQGATSAGYRDIFLTKYLPDGNKVWTRQLGTSNDDEGWALTTGIDGSIYLSGYTTGNLEGQVNNGGYDAFLTKFTPDGNKSWTKLIGTSGDEKATALTTGNDGAIYISGDNFLSKLDSAGSIVWTHTQASGNSAYSNIKALCTGLDGAIFGTSGNSVTKFNRNGSIEWTSQTGGESLWALTPGLDGSIYVSGSTWGVLDGQPYVNGGGFDAFLTKFNPDGSKAWTRSQGTYDNDHPYGLTTGLDGSIYIAGRAGMLNPDSSIDGQPYNWMNLTDTFISRFSPDGSKDWTRLLTSVGVDEPRALTTGLDGSIYISGMTGGALDGQTNKGGNDAFLAKFSVAQQIKFEAGTSTVQLVLSPLADTYAEESESLTLEILESLDYQLGVASATGVIVDGAVFTHASIASGDIKLNGVNLGAIPKAQTNFERSSQMLTAINSKKSITGVSAVIDSITGGLKLSALDGRNIEISILNSAGISENSIGIALNGMQVGDRSVTTYKSSVNLISTSAAGIDIQVTSNGEAVTGLSTNHFAATETIVSNESPSNGSNNGYISSVDISTVDGALSGIFSLSSAIEFIGKSRANIGAYQNRLLTIYDNLANRQLNLSSSMSKIKDADYAVETANLAKSQIIQKASIAMLAQANQNKQSVLALLK